MTAPLIRLTFAMVAALTLAACTVFPEKPAHKIFQLPVPAIKESADESFDTALRISAPMAVAPIDSTRILVKPDSHEIRAYQGARWGNRAPVIVGNHLVEAFRQDGRLVTVVSDTSPARSDLTIVGDLTRFQAEYQNGSPVVHMQLNLQLIDERTRETLSNKRFNVRSQASDESVESVVEAFGQASSELARNVIDWTMQEL
ncbi:ABC-type transport auxiliary lipoprotein family protein [Marinobacter sp.]|uniref:ABC-type transport auxiliary lipoprotein family protein n=1 Tax=Marinobacter sp. TaxID=50741 RepID=UPI0035683983